MAIVLHNAPWPAAYGIPLEHHDHTGGTLDQCGMTLRPNGMPAESMSVHVWECTRPAGHTGSHEARRQIRGEGVAMAKWLPDPLPVAADPGSHCHAGYAVDPLIEPRDFRGAGAVVEACAGVPVGLVEAMLNPRSAPVPVRAAEATATAPEPSPIVIRDTASTPVYVNSATAQAAKHFIENDPPEAYGRRMRFEDDGAPEIIAPPVAEPLPLEERVAALEATVKEQGEEIKRLTNVVTRMAGQVYELRWR